MPLGKLAISWRYATTFLPFIERFFSILFVKIDLSKDLSKEFSNFWSFIGGSVMKNEFDGVSFEVRFVGDGSS